MKTTAKYIISYEIENFEEHQKLLEKISKVLKENDTRFKLIELEGVYLKNLPSN